MRMCLTVARTTPTRMSSLLSTSRQPALGRSSTISFTSRISPCVMMIVKFQIENTFCKMKLSGDKISNVNWIQMS